VMGTLMTQIGKGSAVCPTLHLFRHAEFISASPKL
jgi:hypothetical protein